MRGKKTINFTASIEEIERFRRNVKRANEIQKRYTERQARITGRPVEDIAPLFFKRSANLSQFSNRQEFLDALNESEKLSRKGYMRHIQEIQKENYINAVETVFGEAGQELADKIRRINARTFADMQARGQVPTIGFVYYDPADPDDKIEELEQAIAEGTADYRRVVQIYGKLYKEKEIQQYYNVKDVSGKTIRQYQRAASVNPLLQRRDFDTKK